MTRTENVQEIVFPDPEERTPAILVVEDEVLIRIALSDYLQECGFKVLEAGNADEALEIIQHSPVVIDLVFSDVVMPGKLDGFGLAHWIRINQPGLPIILTSGDAAKAATAKDLCEREPFMAKPYDLQHLVRRIRTLIDSARKKSP
ncbi:MAG TPA: response regulator [Rhizomicrobium sp.]|jgi:DNA-binding response OmpR family regulator|nr:response regulator [Rhizomicrobium sp.]